MAARHEHEVITDADECGLASRWRVALDTIHRLQLAAQDFLARTGREVSITSGYRTAAEQRRLSREGRPTAPDELSTHRSCPATGVDISLGVFPTNYLKTEWGRIAMLYGLWWGGRGELDENYIPIDWQHVDTGRRTS